MALPASPNAISLSQVQTEFGGTNPIAISEYYGAATGVPTSGTISMADFHGKSAAVAPVAGTTYTYWSIANGTFATTGGVWSTVATKTYSYATSGTVRVEAQCSGWQVYTGRAWVYGSGLIQWLRAGVVIVDIVSPANDSSGVKYSSVVGITASVSSGIVLLLRASNSSTSGAANVDVRGWIKTANDMSGYTLF